MGVDPGDDGGPPTVGPNLLASRGEAAVHGEVGVDLACLLVLLLGEQGVGRAEVSRGRRSGREGWEARRDGWALFDAVRTDSSRVAAGAAVIGGICTSVTDWGGGASVFAGAGAIFPGAASVGEFGMAASRASGASSGGKPVGDTGGSGSTKPTRPTALSLRGSGTDAAVLLSGFGAGAGWTSGTVGALAGARSGGGSNRGDLVASATGGAAKPG